VIPPKQRRIIEAVLDLYPDDTPLLMRENLRDGAFFVVEGDAPVIHGSTRMVNWARDIRNKHFVPECYDDEASTWA
jgi:hypothetical protein